MLARSLVALAGVVALASACDDGGSASDDGAFPADVYAAVIRATAPTVPEGTPTVFVAPYGDAQQLPLDTQVAVVERVADDVEVRFVDHEDEAIDSEAPDEHVKADGVLIRVGPVPPGRGPMNVTVERIVSVDDRTVIDFSVTAPVSEDDDAWSAVPAVERPLPTTVPPAD